MLVSAKRVTTLKWRVVANLGGTAGSLIASRPMVDERFLFLDNRLLSMVYRLWSNHGGTNVR
jgi:hypothetical protein